jgi:MFS family permease
MPGDLENSLNPLSGQPPGSIARGSPSLLFATLMLGLISQGLALTAIVSALPEMARDLGPRGEFNAQMTMALTALGLMFGALASGWILEKSGTRVTLLTGLFLFGLTGAVGMVFHEPSVLLASRFGLGFAAACVVTTCLWSIANEYSGGERARAFGISGALSSVAGLVGAVCGGYLAQRGGWAAAFVQYPVFAAVGFLLAYASIRQVKPQQGRNVRGKECGREQLSLKRLLPFYLLVVLLFVVFSMGGTQLPFLLQEDGISDPAIRSLVLGVPTIAATASSLGYGPLQKLLTARGAFTLGLSCMSAGLGLIGWRSSVCSAVLGASLMGICLGLIGPYLYHSVAERADAYSRSRQLGFINAFTFLGVFLNPIVFAPVTDILGLRKVFLIGSLIMALIVLFTSRVTFRSAGAMGKASI